jgi:hypothetical protein
MKGALSSRYRIATAPKLSTRNSAAWTAFVLRSIPTAAATATSARITNKIDVALRTIDCPLFVIRDA